MRRKRRSSSDLIPRRIRYREPKKNSFAESDKYRYGTMDEILAHKKVKRVHL